MIASSAGLMELHGWQTVAPAYKVPFPYTLTSLVGCITVK